MSVTSIAMDIAARRHELDLRVAEAQTRLQADLRAGVAPAVEAAERAMAAANPGSTADGAPLWRRAIAGWDAPPWADTSASAASTGVGGLVRIGVAEVLSIGDGPTYEIPALLPLLGRTNLVFVGARGQLDDAHLAVQSLVLRLLATLPPGKLRLCAVDAVGLGSAFADLLPLDPAVRGAKVWHEEREIGDALADLTAHMSMVVQKYLRSEFRSIEEYNAAAGEVAEPYRLLLVAGFPAGFRPEVAERLLTIARTGPPLGVHVLATVDSALTMPQGFSLAELERHAVVLKSARGRWAWRETAHPMDLTPDGRAPRAIADAILAVQNRFAEQGDDVRVNFGQVVLGEAWSGDASDGIVVPLGRRGARDPMQLKLGQRGTFHHALIGGRTGSGKTVLLHVLICALAHLYSPDEVALYLVDFKEGVEFQVYRDLPHARVVAIQSEREFGLSVLEGLRIELNRRGECFRARNVDDLAGWRRLTGEILPRIVLVVDEFQVFFEASDPIAHSARALLSDLVSRGRSFGIHCVLASQTLSAMDLDARTLSQIGVRIALQMSEADSYKVLGKDNDAARTLQRPGEAIFNEAGGSAATNLQFQVAFLTREEREARVAALHALRPDVVPVRFEGNRPAALAENRALVRRLAAPVTETPRALQLWLGEATAMQEGHASFLMRRQTRGNLVMVGTEEAAAFTTMLAAVTSAAAQVPRGEGLIRVVSLSNPDDPLYDALDVFTALPVPVQVGRHADLEAMIAATHADVSARASDGRRTLAPMVLLVILGLQRGRALEKSGLKASVATTQLAAILSQGPEHGVHVLAWTDTITSLQRTFSTAEVAEFGCRVALVAGDATRVLGPQAASLPALRKGYAWMSVDDEGERVRKFRCYGAETAAWLAAHLKE